MSNDEGIKRVGDFKYGAGHFRGLRVQRSRMVAKAWPASPGYDYAWLERFGLVVRYDKEGVVLVTVETVASAAVEMARDIPAMRKALMEALSAMEQAGVNDDNKEEGGV